MVRVSRRVTKVTHGDELIDIDSRINIINIAGRRTLRTVHIS